MQNSAQFLNVPKTRDLLTDYDRFKTLIHRSSGLDLNAYKFEQTYRRIWNMVERAQCKRFTDFYEYLNVDPKRMRQFMDKLAINVSELFRNPDQFELLAKKIMPALLGNGRPLKIWSAGSSYGAEAYSIAVFLNELAPNYMHKIIGTDIDQEMLDRARIGKFEQSEMKNVTDARRKKFFTQKNETTKVVFQATSSLMKYMNYQTQNLLDTRYPEGFDLIVCRNVVIYFSDEAKDAIFQRFYKSLNPGGYLFIGSTERIMNFKEIGFTNPEPFYYHKPNPQSGGVGKNV